MNQTMFENINTWGQFQNVLSILLRTGKLEACSFGNTVYSIYSQGMLCYDLVCWILCGMVLETETNKFLSSIERWRLCACALFVTCWPTLWISFLFSYKNTIASLKCALEIFVKSECTGNTFIRLFRRETNLFFNPLITHYSPCVEDIHFDICLKNVFC